MALKCTYCGGTEFYEGPSGGMSTNVLCANPKCRHWFNATPALDLLEDLKRVEPTAAEKEQETAKRKAEADAGSLALYKEGADLFRAGKSARACLIDPTYGPVAERRENITRLCGFIDTMMINVGERLPATGGVAK
jgi:hypothetical protein